MFIETAKLMRDHLFLIQSPPKSPSYTPFMYLYRWDSPNSSREPIKKPCIRSYNKSFQVIFPFNHSITDCYSHEFDIDILKVSFSLPIYFA